MSWEHMQCPTCTARMRRTSADYDAEGRIVMGFVCPEDGTTGTLPEPDLSFETRKEVAAREAAEGRV